MHTPNASEIQAVIISQDTLDGLKELTAAINDDTLGIEISPLHLYCQKTGAIIGTRSENSLFQLTKIHGRNAITIALYNSTSLNISPAWLYTNGETLDRMIDADPIGFACYCFGFITQEYYQTAKNKNRKLFPAIERYWAMARANALMVQRGMENLPELNVELTKFLTYAPDTKNYLARKIRKFGHSPDQLALLHCTGDLISLIREATNAALNAIGRGNVALNYNFHVASGLNALYEKANQNGARRAGKDYEAFKEIYATPADAARGPSNVRGMKASKRDVAEAGMFAHLQKMFDDVGLNLRENVPGTSDWLQKRAANQKATEDVLFNSISELGKIDLSDIIAPNDAGDDEVEVRTIARDIVISQDAPKAVEGGPVSENSEETKPTETVLVIETKQLSFREKLALLKKGVK